jgi:hypothetical protein
MHDHGTSDSSVVSAKPPNRAERSEAEVVEGRGLAKGNPREQNAGRTQSQTTKASDALQRIRDSATKKKEERFTSLMQHVYNVGGLRAAYQATWHDAAAGVDGAMWGSYGRSEGGGSQRFIGATGAWGIPGEGIQARPLPSCVRNCALFARLRSELEHRPELHACATLGDAYFLTLMGRGVHDSIGTSARNITRGGVALWHLNRTWKCERVSFPKQCRTIQPHESIVSRIKAVCEESVVSASAARGSAHNRVKLTARRLCQTSVCRRTVVGLRCGSGHD